MEYIAFTIISVLTGLATGVIGAGPEVLIVPLLGIFNILDSTKHRIGTSLFMLLPPIGLFAAIKYYKKGLVDVYPALYMSVVLSVFYMYFFSLVVILYPCMAFLYLVFRRSERLRNLERLR